MLQEIIERVILYYMRSHEDINIKDNILVTITSSLPLCEKGIENQDQERLLELKHQQE